jgi:diaminopimelate epimerase
VLFVGDERAVPVGELGPEIERAERFPHRTNVEFAAKREGRLYLRVWERGVGETRACGTGACATAVAASIRGDDKRVRLPVDVVLPGGTLNIAWDGIGDVVLTGPCAELWSGEWRARAEVAR